MHFYIKNVKKIDTVKNMLLFFNCFLINSRDYAHEMHYVSVLKILVLTGRFRSEASCSPKLNDYLLR